MRLIDADALIDNRSIQMNIGAGDNICIDVSDISKAPTIEAEPVRHGRWIPVGYDGYADGLPVYGEWECSECRFEVEGEGEPPLNYCPECGAKMDGGDENEYAVD